jgi:hypothetical protein
VLALALDHEARALLRASLQTLDATTPGDLSREPWRIFVTSAMPLLVGQN